MFKHGLEENYLKKKRLRRSRLDFNITGLFIGKRLVTFDFLKTSTHSFEKSAAKRCTEDKSRKTAPRNKEQSHSAEQRTLADGNVENFLLLPNKA